MSHVGVAAGVGAGVGAGAGVGVGHSSPVSPQGKDQKQLWNTCQQLEQVFLEIMLQQMTSSVGKSKLLPQSFEGNLYQDMQRQSLAEQMAKSGGIGLAATLYRQLQRELAASAAAVPAAQPKQTPGLQDTPSAASQDSASKENPVQR